MCSSVNLAQMHMRLDEIFAIRKINKTAKTTYSFGGVNIMALGDMCQVCIYINV